MIGKSDGLHDGLQESSYVHSCKYFPLVFWLGESFIGAYLTAYHIVCAQGYTSRAAVNWAPATHVSTVSKPFAEI